MAGRDLVENTITHLIDKHLGFVDAGLIGLIFRRQCVHTHQIVHFDLARDLFLNPRRDAKTTVSAHGIWENQELFVELRIDVFGFGLGFAAEKFGEKGHVLGLVSF